MWADYGPTRAFMRQRGAAGRSAARHACGNPTRDVRVTLLAKHTQRLFPALRHTQYLLDAPHSSGGARGGSDVGAWAAFLAFWRVGRHCSASRTNTSLYCPPSFAVNMVCIICPIRVAVSGFPGDLAKVNCPRTRKGTSRSARIFPAAYLHAIYISKY